MKNTTIAGKTKNIKQSIKTYGTKQAIKGILSLLSHLSDANIVRLTKFAETITANEAQKERVKIVREKFEKGHPSLEIARRIAKKLTPQTKEKIAQNLFINAMFLGTQKRNRIYHEEGWRPPFFFVISPSMRCNLNCIGCYAGSYTKADVLTTRDIDKIFTEAKELGIYFITVSGGEPFFRKDLMDLWEKHSDMYFLVYTNGTLIDEKVAEKLGRMGNVAPAISVEGFKEQTNFRRGPGVFDKITSTWKILKENGVLFGFSATCTRLNAELIYSDEFIDSLIENGALFGWYFQYIPIGKGPDTELMATPKQRHYVRERLQTIRETKPIILADFWNDGHLAGGCIAGGRVYFHINVNGDVEPCVFTHFAVDNIKNTSLKDALNSKLFKIIKSKQPYSKNLMCPCMIIDEPAVLRQIIAESGARATHSGAESLLKDNIADFLDKYSKELHSMWDPLWESVYDSGKKLKAIDKEISDKILK
ncbi:MAG: radical SAM protein [Candidatus Omnitrophica bacterium]|jgi:MoaA/NifB/PqqE/SkfB family radical SAM enzyme|nr:radical SAM protein [Candidatus Omnitrophota bacterium]